MTLSMIGCNNGTIMFQKPHPGTPKMLVAQRSFSGDVVLA